MSTVDSTQAFQVISRAYARATAPGYVPTSKFNQFIKNVLFNKHLTYKYILVTALLAKATNQSINALCLQATSGLTGAYDARSLCHEVLVPFERKNFSNAFGNSNEPFLNKPARIPSLSLSNPVRRGNDKNILTSLCTFLPQITSSTEAFDALSDSMFFAVELADTHAKKFSVNVVKMPAYSEINEIICQLLADSFEGQSLALATGGLLKLLAFSLDGNVRVEAHVVNQSGASSKEISDIDVYLEENLLYAVEAKDKTFSAQDVEHAVSKVAASKNNRLMFIKGPRASLQGSTETKEINKARNLGVYLTFWDYLDFSTMILSLVSPASLDGFISGTLEISQEARLKTEVQDFFLEICRQHSIIA
jgi:hypothetical protein